MPLGPLGAQRPQLAEARKKFSCRALQGLADLFFVSAKINVTIIVS